jgi:lipopolysaccharide transport system permease protein
VPRASLATGKVPLADLGHTGSVDDMGSFSGGEAVSAAATRPVAAAGGAVTTRESAKARLSLRQTLAYGPLIRALAKRDLKARYKQSVLGPAWVVFQPLALLAAFSVGFRSVAHVETGGVPYALFALTGLIVWTYFQAVAMVAAASIVNNYQLVRWTACPRLALPLATLVANLPSFVVPLLAALIAAGATGYLWLGTLVVPALFLWMIVLVGVFALFLSALSVRARDMLSVLPFLLQVTLFLCPIAYNTAQLSPTLRTLIAINPLTGLIEVWRWAVLGVTPNMMAVVISLCLTAVGALAAWRMFARLEVRMADEI